MQNKLQIKNGSNAAKNYGLSSFGYKSGILFDKYYCT